MSKNRNEEEFSLKDYLKLLNHSFKYEKNESLRDRLNSYGKDKITLVISIIVGCILLVLNIIFLIKTVGIIEKVIGLISVVLGIFILILSFLIAKKNKELLDYFSDIFSMESENIIGFLLMFFGVLNLFIPC